MGRCPGTWPHLSTRHVSMLQSLRSSEQAREREREKESCRFDVVERRQTRDERHSEVKNSKPPSSPLISSHLSRHTQQSIHLSIESKTHLLLFLTSCLRLFVAQETFSVSVVGVRWETTNLHNAIEREHRQYACTPYLISTQMRSPIGSSSSRCLSPTRMPREREYILSSLLCYVTEWLFDPGRTEERMY